MDIRDVANDFAHDDISSRRDKIRVLSAEPDKIIVHMHAAPADGYDRRGIIKDVRGNNLVELINRDVNDLIRRRAPVRGGESGRKLGLSD